MASEISDYAAKLAPFENGILDFLRTSESIQENLKLREVRPAQARMVESTGDLFRRFNADFAPLSPPRELAQIHPRIVESAAELEKSFNLFMTEPGPNWTVAFLYSRRSFCRALYSFYELGQHLPIVSRYFMPLHREADDTSAAPSDHGGGFIHRERNEQRSDYSLYIPESHTREQPTPLIICLHGGYGEGYEYIWTWLRSARARGYMLLSPKSLDVTWTMTPNSIDTRSILRMLDEVEAEYPFDRSRLFLTGLSDGGMMTYILGIERHEMFNGIAPVAGALHPVVDSMLRVGTGRELPIFVVHGVHDFIFPVAFTRQTNQLLQSLGYNLKYEELPEWGHAFPYSINEGLVMPWFESLHTRG
ncbi:MAG: hypothetical protein JO166_01830 [Deltaproteobacteria bacterium]|nr:hypothetical protein [Deltaproteobacteria bacterium]